ncbi:glycoside hydrolase domain-containing protein [Puniceicoccus vermicola]|uniref:Glycoside hydrolase 123-like N-terminal domain-containing protein n=1 Tax=Puniceicoccus vermicola TaxID=388746 RepID=A0A7X1E5I8_9BACT|nr:glycoside hydrolase domain-containing protein [Puniceicoccus vermicola]MBC2603184.1 hypothetical protein [Puniceicoccus vermicola]
MSQSPTVDGVIDPEEWKEAVEIGGAVDQSTDLIIPRPGSFYLAWDPEHIYMAFRTYIREGYKPEIAAGRSQGQAYIWDEGMELGFQPLGMNRAPGNAGTSYKFFLNALGFYGDTARVALGQQSKSWSPKFESNARITEPGTAPNGGSWLEVEFSGSIEDFELIGPNQAGDRWNLMLGINHFPKWMQARIPAVGAYLNPDGYSQGILVENTPVAKMSMDSLANLASDGTASMKVEIYNPTTEPIDARVDVEVGKSISRKEVLTVAPGASASFELNEKLPEEEESGSVNLEVSYEGGSLMTYNAFFEVGKYERMLRPVAPRDPTKFSFDGRFNPDRSWLHVKADAYYLPDPDQADSLEFTVIKDGSSEPVYRGTLEEMANWYFQDIVELPELEVGDYRIEGELVLKDGTTLGPVVTKFEKKDEAKEFARWWGKTYGDIERVLPPYTEIEKGKVDDSSVTYSPLGRKYSLNALGLPTALDSAGGSVLSAPARVVVVADGEEISIPIGAPEISVEKDWKIEFTGSAQGAGLDFEAKGWLEQDGLVYVDLTYQPRDGKSVMIDSMRIEYPLSEKDADGLLCVGPGENYSSRSTILLDNEKEGSLWSTHDTGVSGSQMTVGSFYPTVWIGSERRGFLWWADNDKGWVQANDVPAHEVVRQDGDVVLINHIVGRPIELNEPKTIAFSYLATPFRPLVQGFRTTQSTEDGTFFGPFRGVRDDSKTGEPVFVHRGGLGHVNWIHPESRYPEEWDQLWEQQRTVGIPGTRYMAAEEYAREWQWRDPYKARAGTNLTHMSFQIMGYGRKSLENETYEYFGAAWEGSLDTWNDSYIDYAMSLFDSAFKKGGVLSTYWDLAFPILFEDPLSGLSYFLPDGRVQKGYNGWNIRRFMMRLHALQYDSGLVPGANGLHSSNAYLTVAMPWADAVLDGERNWELDTTDLDWIDVMPIERMRSMSVSANWGVSICWMANMFSRDPGKIVENKRIQGQWVWMHDSWLNPYIPQLGSMPEQVLDFGVNDRDTVYHPYWRNHLASSSNEDILVSVWEMEGRVMLGILNYDKNHPQSADIEIDFEELGLEPNQVVSTRLWSDEMGWERRDQNRMRSLERDYEKALAKAEKRGGPVPAKPDMEPREYPLSIASTELEGDTLKVRDLAGHRLILVGLSAPEPASVERAKSSLPEWAKEDLIVKLNNDGFVDARTQYLADDLPGISGEDAEVTVTMWQLPDRILLTVFNNGERPKDVDLGVDLDALNLVPELPWQEFVGIRQIQAEEGAPQPDLDFYGRSLSLRKLSPDAGRVVSIRRF